MLYATLEEAYPNYVSKNKNKKKSQPVEDETETFINDYGRESECYYKKQGIDMPTCSNSEKFANKKDCSPLQPPEYKLPIDSNSLNAYNKALDASLRIDKVENNYPEKYSIKAYDYDEYDAYLNINDVSTNNKDTSPEYRTTPFLEEYLKSLRDNLKKSDAQKGLKLNDIEQFTNYNRNFKVDVNLYNLFLFIFIGIIVILLCDQITKLAITLANKNI
jgi:hypothetical protein